MAINRLTYNTTDYQTYSNLYKSIISLIKKIKNQNNNIEIITFLENILLEIILLQNIFISSIDHIDTNIYKNLLNFVCNELVMIYNKLNNKYIKINNHKVYENIHVVLRYVNI